MNKKFKKQLMKNRLLIMLPILIIGSLFVLNLAGVQFLMPEGEGDTSTTAGNAPTVSIQTFEILGTDIHIQFSITDSDSQIRSYYVILYIEGKTNVFLTENSVADGPYGSTVSHDWTLSLHDYEITTTADEEKTIKVECTDTQGKYASAEKVAEFSFAYPDRPIELGIQIWPDVESTNPQLTISWKAGASGGSAYIGHFNIYRKQEHQLEYEYRGSVSFSTSIALGSGVYTFVDEVAPSAFYWYEIRAVSSVGEGEGIALGINIADKAVVDPLEQLLAPSFEFPFAIIVGVLIVWRRRRE